MTLLALIAVGLFSLMGLLFVTGAAVIVIGAEIAERGHSDGVRIFFAIFIGIMAIVIWLLFIGLWASILL